MPVPAPEDHPFLKALLRFAPKGDAAVQLWTDIFERRMERLEMLGAALETEARVLGVNIYELLDHIRKSEELTDLFSSVMQAAASSSSEKKINAFARAIASGALGSDDSAFDVAALIVRALDQMESADIRFLLQLRTRDRPPPNLTFSFDGSERDATDSFDPLVPKAGDEIVMDDPNTLERLPERDAIIARLTQLGVLQVVELAELQDAKNGIESAWVETKTQWFMTSFGAALVKFLEKR